MARLPLFLDLSGRQVLLVGGGEVATRRGRLLHEAGANVLVVAPTISADLSSLATHVHERAFAAHDLAGAWLVLACTDDPKVNAEVAALCEAEQIWCVRADTAEDSPAWFATTTATDEVTVAVSAHGDPGRAVATRNAIADLLATGTLPTRRTREGVGHVALIGGGPGHPGLITVRGRQLLAAADVVIIDRLAPRSLLEELDPDVEVIDAGKSSHSHNLTQDQINALIIDRARQGKRVARLKGGDPFVFGRGGEEALECVAAGIAFEVVPGVTSAISVPALAGIPVTHRGISQDVSIISAHLDPSAPGSTVDWGSLAKTQGTLVLLMAVERLGSITDALIAGGRSPNTPVAVIANGSTSYEQVESAHLSDIAALCIAREIKPPAIVVIGEVVGLRARLVQQ